MTHTQLSGKYGNAIVYTDNVEESAASQIVSLLNQSAFEGSSVKIMPDVHAGAGCVIGYTARLTGRVVPNLIGVDIGCGVLAVKTDKTKINFEKLDRFIRQNIPFGFERNKRVDSMVPDSLRNTVVKVAQKIRLKEEEQLKGIGSLGGGNHFIEIDEDQDGSQWVVIHSGSRNFGLQVAQYHQRKAAKYCESKTNENKSRINQLLGKMKQQTNNVVDFTNKIEQAQEDGSVYNVPKALSFLEKDLKDEYLYDLSVAQSYAKLNREIMMHRIMEFLNASEMETILSVHNYINFDDKIVRKGAISAHKGQKIIIPLNMRDGIIIGIGKGNEQWNLSAPHGAGRILSRTRAKQILHLDEFQKTMKGIWTSCVGRDTLDESPMAYKPMEEIIAAVHETMDISDKIKPLYNFKAGEE